MAHLIGIFLSAIVLFFVAYILLQQSNFFDILVDPEILNKTLRTARNHGPLLIIAFMTIAVVLSPIPSAPIALASGAFFGHFWGALYVLIGAELGAIIAFMVARLTGRQLMQKIFGEKINIRLTGSQNMLMIIVGASRLIPFISFDIISYAAGLTPLTFLRFALATLVGIIPASFLLAHFGEELSSGEAQRITVTVLLLGSITLIPFIAGYIYRRYHRH